MRDRLGENYKKFLERFLALIEKKRSEFLEKCFDNHRTHDEEGRTTYVYDKTRRYLNGFDIFVLGKDQASCTHCHDILPIPTAGRSILEPLPFKDSFYERPVICLPEICIPSSLPEFIVEKFLIQDLRRIEEKAASVSEIRWEWDHSPHTKCTDDTYRGVKPGLSQESHRFCLGFLHFVVSCS